MRTEEIKSFVVGKESKISKNNEPYGVITVMDGTNPLNLVTKDKALFDSIEPFKQCSMVLDITMGKYPKVEIVRISNIK